MKPNENVLFSSFFCCNGFSFLWKLWSIQLYQLVIGIQYNPLIILPLLKCKTTSILKEFTFLVWCLWDRVYNLWFHLLCLWEQMKKIQIIVFFRLFSNREYHQLLKNSLMIFEISFQSSHISLPRNTNTQHRWFTIIWPSSSC